MFKRRNNKIDKYGKEVYEDNKIIVYVKQRVIFGYKTLPFDVEKGKDVSFIFDGLNFDEQTCINGSNANLIFRNCRFSESLKIENAKFIKMENNKYYFFGLSNNFIDLTADKIEIKDNFENEYFAKNFDEADVNISLMGNSININNSVVCCEFGGRIDIIAGDLLLNNSVIKSRHVNISANNIATKASVIKSPKEIIIDNKNCNFTCTIKSPIIIYNNIKLNSLNSEIINIDEEKVKLLEERIKLIEVLNTMKTNCIEENSTILSKVEKELNNKRIAKVLKR